MKQGRSKLWFDVGTALWAIALVVVAGMWMAGPAFAFEEGNCLIVCEVECEGHDGCSNYYPDGRMCYINCNDGWFDAIKCTPV